MTKHINDISLDSFFQDRIVDPNGVSVTDINAGLRNLFYNFNEYENNFTPDEKYFVSEIEEGYPDLVAKRSILGNQDYWWWITLLNRLENPMTDFKTNWVYSINNYTQISDFINTTNEETSSNSSRLGKVVELN